MGGDVFLTFSYLVWFESLSLLPGEKKKGSGTENGYPPSLWLVWSEGVGELVREEEDFPAQCAKRHCWLRILGETTLVYVVSNAHEDLFPLLST